MPKTINYVQIEKECLPACCRAGSEGNVYCLDRGNCNIAHCYFRDVV